MIRLTRCHDSCDRLSARAIAQPDVVISFDKDDDDTLDFALATANLRSIAYGIPTKTRFEVKGERKIGSCSGSDVLISGVFDRDGR
jgi:hypothetical protein